MTQTKESIENYASKRRDSETIMQRIKDVDLVAAQAKYHQSCYDKYRFPTTLIARGYLGKRGRPESDSTIRAMDDIYTFIQSHNEECQFTINDFKSAVSGVCPDDRTILKKIKEKYGDQIVISSSVGKPTFYCFGNAPYIQSSTKLGTQSKKKKI